MQIVLPIWRITATSAWAATSSSPRSRASESSEKSGIRSERLEEAADFELIEEVQPMKGARKLIEELKGRGHSVVLASSAKEDEVDHYLDLLDARDLADSWTTSADVESTKPEPDLVHAALDRAGSSSGAVMVGDTTWDVKAAERAGVQTLAVMTGGFAPQELREAGAIDVSSRSPSCASGSAKRRSASAGSG